MLRECTCKQCGIVFTGGPRAWYCPDCRLVRAQAADRKAKYFGTQRPIGSADKCVICNEIYIVSGGLQKYCPKCAPEANKTVMRKQSLDYYVKNKNTINPARNEARRKSVATCEFCGKEFDPQGTCRNTCSPECRRKLKNKKWLVRYYAKK